MKIVAGLSSIDDYIRLVNAGADEVFIGYIPFEWTKTYGNLFPLNRRENLYFNSQIKSFEDMKILKKMVDVYNVPVSITFNNIYYIEEQYELIGKIISKLIDIGFERFIIADIGLLLYLSQNNIKCSVHLSGECAETNRYSIEFFNKLNITRYIFNRKNSIEEIKSCINYTSDTHINDNDMNNEEINNMHHMEKAAVYKKEDKDDEPHSYEIIDSNDNMPAIEYEAFILNERCHYTGAFCSSLHCDEMIHLCEMPFNIGKVDELSYDFPECDKRFEEYYEHAYEVDKNMGNSAENEYKLGFTGCGLCSLKKLQMAGITHLKVVGRGNSIKNIEKDVISLKRALSMIEDTEDCKAYENRIKNELFKGRCSEKCYYSEGSRENTIMNS